MPLKRKQHLKSCFTILLKIARDVYLVFFSRNHVVCFYRTSLRVLWRRVVIWVNFIPPWGRTWCSFNNRTYKFKFHLCHGTILSNGSLWPNHFVTLEWMNINWVKSQEPEEVAWQQQSVAVWVFSRRLFFGCQTSFEGSVDTGRK